VSLAFLVVAFVAAVNPCRARLGFPGPWPPLVLGSALAGLAAAALAAVGEDVLDALDVSPESFRLAAGFVLAVEGARTLPWPRPATERGLPGRWAAVVPVAFPILLQPGVVVLALATGGDEVVGKAVAALAVALGIAAAAGAIRGGARAEGLLVAGSRLLGAIELSAGVVLAVDALRDV
jgi:small neutral amino acid transporter SnatA (MarC family)